MNEETKETEEQEVVGQEPIKEEGDNTEEALTAAGESDEASPPLSEVESLQQELENLKQQADENLDKALRAAAEMENLRKRTSRDIENAHKYALEKFIRELLPVVDSMELGISASDNAEDIAGLKEGMDLTLKMFIDSLNKSGVEVIDPQGEKFDPELHQAVSMTEIEGSESGQVVTVMQKGYSLNGRLVRPAMVVVSK